MTKWYLLLALLLAFTAPAETQSQSWEPTNGPLGGAARSLAINSMDEIFVGSHGGVFYSASNGDSWQRTDGNLNSSFITRILVSADSNYLFVGTANVGLYTSADKGNSWDRLNTALPSTNIRDIKNGLNGELIVGSDGDGIFRSPDNGASWTAFNNGLADLRVFAAGQSNNGDLYAGTIGTGIYRHGASDTTWRAISDGLGSQRCSWLLATGADEMLAGTGRGVYKIVAGDTTWTAFGSNTNSLGFVTSLFRDGTGQLFATTLGGVSLYDAMTETWNAMNNGLTNLRTWEMTANQAGTLFLVSDAGIFRSEDNGATWTYQVDGFKIARIEAMVGLPDGTVLAGTEANGIFRTSDDGMTWERSDTGLSSFGIRAMVMDSNGDIFAGISGVSGVARSTDQGNSWEVVRNGFNGSNVTALAATSDRIYAAPSNSSIAISADGGDSWAALPDSGLPNASIRALVANSQGDLFAGTSNAGVFRLTESGTMWTEVNNGLSNLSVTSLAINASGDLFAGITAGFHHSSDNGNTWTEIDLGLSTKRVNVVKTVSDLDIFVGSLVGVAVSRDNGTTWTQITSGLENPNITSLAILPNGEIFAGSHGDGVYRSQVVLSSVESQDDLIPMAFELSQNYPNPFNPSTSIQYTLPHSAHVKLTIFNALGQEVKTLVNATLRAGTYTTQWDGTNANKQPVASGLYIYRLQSENLVTSKKLVLMR